MYMHRKIATYFVLYDKAYMVLGLEACKQVYKEWMPHRDEAPIPHPTPPHSTHTVLGSEKTSVCICIIRSPPIAYSMTKHTWSLVWKHANRLTRNGCLIEMISHPPSPTPPHPTHTVLGSEKTSVCICIVRSPPISYSMTKHTWSLVWKHANRFTRNGCLIEMISPPPSPTPPHPILLTQS